MKLFDLLNKELSDNDLAEKIKNFNWDYDFSENIDSIKEYEKDLKAIQQQVYYLWKSAPEKAIKMWWDNAKGTPQDKTITPSFIVRLEENG